MTKNDAKLTIIILVVLVIILAGLVVYSFVIKPVVNGYVTSAQTQGMEFAVFSIMKEAAGCQQVTLNFRNQTMNLIDVECLQTPSQEPI